MGSVTFKRVNPHESRIYDDGDHVSDVYRRDDILAPGRVYYVLHLFENPRGPRRGSVGRARDDQVSNPPAPASRHRSIQAATRG